MKSKLLQEIEQILEREEVMGVTLPIPNYLYVQKFGRSIEADMNEITKLLGRAEWFAFKADSGQNKSILARFLLEQECKASLGKEFTGCVLVELSGDEKKELTEFLDYIDSQKSRLTCIYTTKAIEQAADFKKQLAQYGFVRMTEGECYDAYEQLELFESTLESYQFALEDAAQKKLVEWFRKKEWQEQDAVMMQIQNMAKSAVYQKMLNSEGRENRILEAEVCEVLAELCEDSGKKRQIGFVQEA